MKLNARVSKLELRNRQLGPALVPVREDETEQQALQRCHPEEKPKVIVYLDKWDLLA